MQKKFIKNLALVLTLNLLVKPFWILGIDRSVQNVLGAEEYGFYYAIMNFTFLLNILLDLGITNFNNRNIAQNNHMLQKHLPGIIGLKLVLGFVYLVMLVAFAFLIRYSARHFLFLIALAFNQFLISFVLYLRSNLSGLHLFKLDSFISVLDRLIMIALCAVLLWGRLPFRFTVEWYILAQTAAYLATALITLAIVLRKAGIRRFRLRWNLPFFLLIIKKSFPFAILILLMGFYNRIDTVMMERMLPDGAEQSGIYASAYRLLDATNMIAFLFAGLLLPIFSRMLKHRDSVDQMVKLSFTLLFIPAAIIATGSFFYRYELMALLYKEHIEASAAVFGLLMSCFVPIATTYIFGTLLTANGNLKQLNLMASCGMVLNICLNLFLIPRMQAVGSAIASLITQFLTCLAQVLIARKVFRFRTDAKLLLRLFVFVVGVILINFASFRLGLGWKAAFTAMVLASFTWAVLLRLLSFRGLYAIVRYGD